VKHKLINRELSWLAFNHRVLQEARDITVPLYERIKFLAIYSSNLDEFFRVRVASLRALLRLHKKSGKKAFNPSKLLKKIHETVGKQQTEFGEIFRNEILPELNSNGIFLTDNHSLTQNQKEYLDNFFNDNFLKMLQPILLTKKKITVCLKNNQLYLSLKLHEKHVRSQLRNEKRRKAAYALVEITSGFIPRFVTLPSEDNVHSVIISDDIIRYSIGKLFGGYEIAG